MAGNTAPDIENPVPERAIELTVSGPLPEEVRVKVLVDVEFNVTVPKSRVLTPTVS